MGWKNVKTHHGIGHYVCVTRNGICIGSGYVHDLICISETDAKRDWHDEVRRSRVDIGCNLTIWRPTYLGKGKPFDDWVAAMAADPATLRQLIDSPDTFERALPVYTYDYDGNIVEKACEEHGWPNVTHDGAMMYENTFSPDRAKVIEWAKRNLDAARESAVRRVADDERDLQQARDRLARLDAALAKLQTA